MNNIIVLCQTNEKGESCQIGLELLTEGRRLAAEAGVKLEAVVIGHGMYQATETIKKYGAQTIYSLSGDKLINETTKQETILTEDQCSNLMNMLGLTITWEEDPQ